MLAPERFAHDLLPFTEYCHCRVGVGLPVAAAVKVSDCPE